MIQQLASEEAIQLVTTSVTCKECKKRIEKMVRAARNHFKDKDVRFTLGILKQTSLNCSFLTGLDADTLSAEVSKQFDDYLAACKAVVCRADGIAAEAIPDAYFEGRPPLGDGQKKDQFPDAVTMAALAKWQAKNGNPLHVVSNDKDLEAGCKGNLNLVFHNSISEFLDWHNKGEGKLSEFVENQMEEQEEEIKAELGAKFEELGFVLVGEDGDVEGATVDEVEIEQIDIICLRRDMAIVELTAKVHFTAELTYGDPNTGYYDSEDGCCYGMKEVTVQVELAETVTTEVELNWNQTDPERAEIDIGPLSPREIEIRYEHDDGWPYK